MTKSMEASEKVGLAAARLAAQFPFFGAFLLKCNIQEITEEVIQANPGMKGCETMCTDGKRIAWHRKFVDTMSRDETMGVLAHEVLHIVFKHHLRRSHREPGKWNTAADFVIDPIVLDANMALPKFEGPNMHDHHDRKYDGHSAEQVYELLPEQPAKPMSGIGGVVDSTGEGGQPMSADEQAMAELEIDQLAVVAAEAQKQSKQRGNLPAGLEQYIKKLMEPKVNWAEKLRRFVGGEHPDHHSMRRPNRAHWKRERIIAPTIEKTGVGHIVIAVDTSGSVSDRELSQFLSEMNAITDEFRPSLTTLIQCDADVQKVEEFEPGNPIDVLRAKGRGGTRVRPVFDYVDQNIDRVDRLIYLTDMGIGDWGSAPDYPVLWVGTVDSPAPWGEFTYIKVE